MPDSSTVSSHTIGHRLRQSIKGPAGLLLAAGLVLFALFVRLGFNAFFGDNVPYLQFFPAVLLAAWWGGLAPGLLATALSAVAAAYFFLPPDGLSVGGLQSNVSLALFLAIGAGIAWLSHEIRQSESAQREAASLASARAERLEAIINTTVDGIIVIDSKGCIEAFNRGAERLFRYPASEVVGRMAGARSR